MRFGNYYKDLELLSSQPKALGDQRRQEPWQSCAPTQTQRTFGFLPKSYFVLVYRYKTGTDVGCILKRGNWGLERVRPHPRSRALRSAGNNEGLVLYLSAKELPLVVWPPQGPWTFPTCFIFWRRALLTPFLLPLAFRFNPASLRPALGCSGCGERTSAETLRWERRHQGFECAGAHLQLPGNTCIYFRPETELGLTSPVSGRLREAN